MLVSVAAYTLLWSWKFAIGFVLLLLVHEMGHVLQARREGLDASAPVFIPFLGAAILLKDLDKKDAATEARVGLAGPVLGSLGALACVGLYEATGNEMYQALAFVGFFLNLFNLLPVLPLDGGRAMAALSPWMWIAGYVTLVVMAVLYPNPIMLLILLFGGFETWRRFKGRKSTEGRTYLRVRPRTRWAVAGVYVALAVALAFGHGRHLRRAQPRRGLVSRGRGAPIAPARSRGAARAPSGRGACRPRPCRAPARSRPWRSGP